MDFAYTEEDEAFRSELQTWLDEHLPEFLEQGEIGEEHTDETRRTMARRQAWQQRLHEGEPPQAAEVQRRAAEPDRRARTVRRRVGVGAHGRGDVEAGHPRGRASYSVRVGETGSVRTISKRSASAASKPGLS